MNFNQAFYKIIMTYADIEQVPNSDYLWQIDGIDKAMTEEEVIAFAKTI